MGFYFEGTPHNDRLQTVEIELQLKYYLDKNNIFSEFKLRCPKPHSSLLNTALALFPCFFARLF